jgi:hypothetical protein
MPKKQDPITQLARQFGFSPTAVTHLWEAMIEGRGTMAQFNHPELGGMGQWQAGGMLMIGDMFNHSLKAKVAALCQATQPLVIEYLGSQAGEPRTSSTQTPQPGWPREYGPPDVSGAQNNIRYAYFAGASRLVVEIDGVRQIYDTGNHRITGFSQQDGRLRFRSQLGTFDLSELFPLQL